MSERVAPRQLLYQDQLPLAIPSRSHRRHFFPEGGSTYGPSGSANPNIVRIPISADSMLDCQHSYLQFDITNKHAAGTKLALDLPGCQIKRIRIESNGTTLEEISENGRLYCGILFPAQADAGTISELSNNYGGNTANSGAGYSTGLFDKTLLAAESFSMTGAVGTANDTPLNVDKSAASRMGQASDKDIGCVLDGGESSKVCIPLVSGLLNMEKYLPLVMMSGGIVLEIEWADKGGVGYSATHGQVIQAAAAPQLVTLSDNNWDITNVRYVAHLIDLERDFYDRLRMVMEGSGGSLQLAGQTFRHFSGNFASGGIGGNLGDINISVPNRVKSVKSIFFKMTPQSLINASNPNAVIPAAPLFAVGFPCSTGINADIGGFQFRVGSVLYPPTQVAFDDRTNHSEVFMELKKAFGTVGFASDGSEWLNCNTCWSHTAESFNPPNHFPANANSEAGSQLPYWSFAPFGLDFESFPRTALESGVNTADFSLPTTLTLKDVKISAAAALGHGNLAGVQVDIYVLADALFYVNLDGSVSVSV